MAPAPKPSYPAFFSYAHARGGDHDHHPNVAYYKFFDHICAKLYQLMPYEGDVAFVDKSIRTGTVFSELILERLTQFQVFVPVISLDYFNREWCGREWAAFEKRCERLADSPYPPIVPILWTGLDGLELPKWFSEKYLYDDAVLNAQYKRHGIFGLQSRYPRPYQSTVYDLAELISQVARTARLTPGTRADLHGLRPRFGGDI